MVGRELAHALAAHTVVSPTHAHIDITDAAAVEHIVVKEKPDFIINAAAIIDANAIEQDPALGIRVNVQGATAIAHAATIHAVPQVLISSSYVFGESALSRVEDAERNPANLYGKTKVDAEDAVMACGSSAPWYIVRTSWIYSPYRSTFVDEVAQMLLQGKPFEASMQRGDPTYGGDFAEAMVKHFIDSLTPNGVYHLVNEGGATRYDIASEIARTLGVPEDLVVAKDFPSSAIRPSVTLINTKLPPLPPWRKSLRAYILMKYRSPEAC